MAPLMCTQNTLFHIDYGTPLIAKKSTDYRTSTGKYHDLMPSIGQNFDCRVPARIKPELVDRDIALRDECKSTYATHHFEKRNDENSLKRSDRGLCSSSINYIRNIQEKIFMNPPPLKPPKISEMKESYPYHFWRPHRDTYVNNTCEMPETYRGVQPNIYPEERGYQKLLDIYLTENRSKFIPYTSDQLQKAQEDLITIYNSSGKHKGLKEELPGKLHGYKNMYNKSDFKVEFPNRIFSKAPKRVPNFGMVSEYQSNYPKPAYSDFYPYLQESGIYFPESLSGSGPWQNLCPPAMYCSENCHIGTGWPVRAAVDINSDVKTFVHAQPCCTKLE